MVSSFSLSVSLALSPSHQLTNIDLFPIIPKQFAIDPLSNNRLLIIYLWSVSSCRLNCMIHAHSLTHRHEHPHSQVEVYGNAYFASTHDNDILIISNLINHFSCYDNFETLKCHTEFLQMRINTVEINDS